MSDLTYALAEEIGDPDLFVGRKQEMALVSTDERFPDFPTLTRSNRNVLKIRALRLQATSRRHCLIVGCVDSPRRFIHLVGKGIHIGRLQLAYRAVLKDPPHDFMLTS